MPYDSSFLRSSTWYTPGYGTPASREIAPHAHQIKIRLICNPQCQITLRTSVICRFFAVDASVCTSVLLPFFVIIPNSLERLVLTPRHRTWGDTSRWSNFATRKAHPENCSLKKLSLFHYYPTMAGMLCVVCPYAASWEQSCSSCSGVAYGRHIVSTTRPVNPSCRVLGARIL